MITGFRLRGIRQSVTPRPARLLTFGARCLRKQSIETNIRLVKAAKEERSAELQTALQVGALPFISLVGLSRCSTICVLSLSLFFRQDIESRLTAQLKAKLVTLLGERAAVAAPFAREVMTKASGVCGVSQGKRTKWPRRRRSWSRSCTSSRGEAANDAVAPLVWRPRSLLTR